MKNRRPFRNATESLGIEIGFACVSSAVISTDDDDDDDDGPSLMVLLVHKSQIECQNTKKKFESAFHIVVATAVQRKSTSTCMMPQLK